jgi:opacity protein-like surface antigen
MRRALVALLLGTLVAGGVSAQGTKVVPGLGLGIDVGESPLQVIGSPGGVTTSLLVPVMIGKRFRLQPWVGYLSASLERTSSTFSSNSRVRRLNLGLAAHYLFPVKDALRIYLGGGIGFGWSKVEDRASNGQGNSFVSTEKRTDRLLNAVAGGEYFFSPRFSIGGELRLDYVTFGDPDFSQTITPPQPVPPVPLPPTSEDLSVTQTSAQVTVRWYFGEVR